MISFLPISILAYALNGGALIIDKILLKKSIPNPIAYAFYINLLGLLVILLIPFGFTLPDLSALRLSAASGIVFTLALYAFFTSLKQLEASVVGSIVGALNPLFALLIGGAILNQAVTPVQMMAIFLLILGSLVLNYQTRFVPSINWWMILAGFLFGLSYVLLREAFLQTTFLNGLIISRLAAGLLALCFLIPPVTRAQILIRPTISHQQTIAVLILLLSGQTMGALSGLLITYAVSLANPALVNSLFGMQYLVILAAALLLYQKHPQLLDERLTKALILQKIMGVLILSFGLYLLSL